MKMTDKAVAALQVPAGERFEYPDDNFPGLWLRCSHTSKVWYFQGRVRRGRWARVKLGSLRLLTVAKARAQAKVYMGSLSAGEDPRDARRASTGRKLTVRAALADYLGVHSERHKPSYRADCERMIGAELEPVADKVIADLDGEQVLRWFKAQASEAVAAKAGRVLRAVLRHTDKRHGVRGPGGRVATEIIGDLRLWPKNVRRQSTLSQPWDWLQSLDGVPGSVADLFRCLGYHGLRRDELRRLTWRQVDLQAGTILLPNPKGRRPQVVPLVRQTLAIIRQRAAEDPHHLSGDAVFSTDEPRPSAAQASQGGRGKHARAQQGRRKVLKSRRGLPVKHGRPIGTSTLQRWVGRVGKASTPFALHDLRRTFISTAANMGVSTYVVKRLVHHADGGDVTAGYVNLNVEQLRQHAQAVADVLFAPPAKVIPFARTPEHTGEPKMPVKAGGE